MGASIGQQVSRNLLLALLARFYSKHEKQRLKLQSRLL